MESPTRLPSARKCAEDSYAKLCRAKILGQGDVADPSDLAAIADVVYAKTGSQEPLVMRMPFRRFQNASPNPGHLDAVALMLENVVGQIVTINFDLTLEKAISKLGADEITIVQSSADFHNATNQRIIYAHGNARMDPNAWVLRSEMLAKEWRGTWAQALAQCALTNPYIVFVGMGSSAPIIAHCVTFIRECLPANAIYQVDPTPFDANEFSAEVGLEVDNYVQGGWTEFMACVAGSLLAEHLAAIEAEAKVQAEANGYGDEGLDSICDLITTLGLTGFGQHKAYWTRSDREYLAIRQVAVGILADIFLGLAAIKRACDCIIERYADSYFLVTRQDGGRFALMVMCGQGFMTSASMEARARSLASLFREYNVSLPLLYVAFGSVSTASPTLMSILEDGNESSILATELTYRLVTIEEVRRSANPIEVLTVC